MADPHMLLFCSTRPDNRARLSLLSQAKLVHETDYANVWLIKTRLDLFVPAIHQLLSAGDVISACIFRETAPRGKEWVYYEWHGRLLIDAGLLEQVLPSPHDWDQTQVRSDLGFAVFVPRATFESAARKYDDLLHRGDRGGVVLCRSWIETQSGREQIFGRYANPEVGGAIALLSLSGATRVGGEDTFTLYTPAALDLEVDNSKESLISESIRRAVRIRCVASQDVGDIWAAEDFKTSREKWMELASEARNQEQAGFFVALELDGKLDPEIAIKRGTVFEQKTLSPVQTLAAAAAVSTIVNVGEVIPLIIPAYCLNRELGPPRGQAVRPTPFVYKRATGTQQEVWQARER